VDSFEVRGNDVFMIVNTGINQQQTVYLGPRWYIERQDFTLNPGDIVQVNVLTPIPNTGIVYAQQLIANGNTLFLRNDAGQSTWWPGYWSAWPPSRQFANRALPPLGSP
ncbi:MAG: hypothetical protein QOJ65_1465, partial [Fimbriimonadaceae bacterium]|nr:hypothetical protein [Fimbriimonadaceae bacterium]